MIAATLRQANFKINAEGGVLQTRVEQYVMLSLKLPELFIGFLREFNVFFSCKKAFLGRFVLQE